LIKTVKLCGSVDKGKGKMVRGRVEERNKKGAIRRTGEGRRKQENREEEDWEL
jgi:hypothetical protein